jgi:hypothetical protein
MNPLEFAEESPGTYFKRAKLGSRVPPYPPKVASSTDGSQQHDLEEPSNYGGAILESWQDYSHEEYSQAESQSNGSTAIV